MLNIKKINTFKQLVNVTFPDGNKGAFDAEFKHFSRKEFDALKSQELPDDEFLDKVIVGISGIGNGDTELPAQEQKEAVIGDLAMSSAAVKAFVSGLVGAERGNSKRSR